MALPQQIVERLAAVGSSPADVSEQFVRGSGPGGQKVNKTSSTVVLVHEPSGTTVRIQNERSQAANRELAWEELVRRLESAKRAVKAAEISDRELQKRRKRQKSRGQKVKMIESKRHRSRIKSARGRPHDD